MPSHSNSRSRGFTLVEMSIVLVIIGLIIGGILKGQEIIASARQKAVINQVNAVRAAANTYFDRYRNLPGDDPAGHENLDSNIVDGDGSGTVGGNVGATGTLIANTATNGGENYQFFNALVAANLLNGAQETAAAAAGTFGVNSALPAAPITGAGLTIAYGTHPGLGANTPSVKETHWLRIHKDPASTSAATTPAMSPRTLANIDTQIDDGAPDTGGVRGDDIGTATTGCNLAASARYTPIDDIQCVGLFEIVN